jgi:hypothetical protein
MYARSSPARIKTSKGWIMKKSESIKEIAVALNKAQNEMGGAIKSSENPFFNSKYSGLPEVIKAIKQPFADNGLSYSQFPIYADGMAGVETILMHTSGEWIESELLMPVTKKDAQGSGSVITYARRYALQSMAGLPSEDDDGNLGSAPANKKAAFKVDDTANNWINAVRADINVLTQLDSDPEYKAFIKTKAGV